MCETIRTKSFAWPMLIFKLFRFRFEEKPFRLFWCDFWKISSTFFSIFEFNSSYTLMSSLCKSCVWNVSSRFSSFICFWSSSVLKILKTREARFVLFLGLSSNSEIRKFNFLVVFRGKWKELVDDLYMCSCRKFTWSVWARRYLGSDNNAFIEKQALKNKLFAPKILSSIVVLNNAFNAIFFFSGFGSQWPSSSWVWNCW